MSLREEQRELTRTKILRAVLDLVAEGAMGDLSVPQVSACSGVSVATIYRYFPSKDDMLDGPAFLRAMWEHFAGHVDLVRRQVASSAGREMRARRYESSAAWLASRFEGAGIDPSSEEGRRLVRLAMLLTSSVAFLDLHDR